ncbi:hypothetical protein CMUST_05270 [Corynebacterium mustelae]|uniref:Transcriptional regulator, TetR family n=1 Tax=Corynebacterium mustelae TaxID=571915 RepID=A0A0G3H2P3_9CORY|nr:TetR/AcrR family transcriptional regulator [Corynebacterium mustelae]AKK05392.1 hypothetical protein CMUST_05270 [Corynebacterium mustelae]
MTAKTQLETSNTDNSPATLTPRQRALFSDILQSFLSDGFETFTIDGATKKFHCSKSTIYSLGRSRDEVIRRILISFFREVTRRTDLALRNYKSPKSALENYFHAIGNALEPASAAFMRDLAKEAVAREIYDTNTKAATRKIADLIEKGIATGDFNTENPDFIAALIATGLEQIQQGVFSELIDAHQAYRQFGTLLLHGLTGN